VNKNFENGYELLTLDGFLSVELYMDVYCVPKIHVVN